MLAYLEHKHSGKVSWFDVDDLVKKEGDVIKVNKEDVKGIVTRMENFRITFLIPFDLALERYKDITTTAAP